MTSALNKKTLASMVFTGALGLTGLYSQSVLADVTIKDGYVREVPPGQMMSAAFMQIENPTDKEVVIVGGKSPNVKSIEVHTHKHVNGVMKMTKLEGLSIAPGETVTLKPGAMHIMLIGLKQSLKADDSFDFDLTFKNGEHQTISLPIKSLIK